MRIGIPKEYFDDALDPEIREAIERKIDVLRKNGATIQEVSLPHTEYTIAAYYILVTAEASSNLARYDGARYGLRIRHAADLSEMYIKSRSEGFGSEVKRRIMLGTYVLSAGYYDAYYRKGQKVQVVSSKKILTKHSSVSIVSSHQLHRSCVQGRRESRRSITNVSFQYLYHFDESCWHSGYEYPVWRRSSRVTDRNANIRSAIW